VILRRLNQTNARIGEGRHQVLQPVRLDHIIGVDDADDFRVRRGTRHGDPQGAGFKPFDLLGIDEDEALAERAAMVLDRLPEFRIGRVVDDHHALEIRVVQPGDGIERQLEHLRRLAIGRDMDRHLRHIAFRCRRRG